jgi:SAM-dependent methyltransferase
METRTATESGSGSRLAEEAYEALAPAYDDFTAHHDYGLWLGELLPRLRRHGLREGRLLDVACGTGKSFLPMLEQDWEVTACDISPAMLEVARAKAGDRVELAVADMRELPAFDEFDLVWCLDDAINYLLSIEELGETLSAMRANLASEGLLLFDVNTIQTYRSFFAGTESVERGGRRLIWNGQAPADAQPGGIYESHFEVEMPDGGEADIEKHIHRQRHFPEAVMLETIAASGLECLDVYGHGLDAILEQPVDEVAHTKMVYIARRI